MLTLTTLFISITESLPKTSYPKMMDIWLLFCLMVPLLEVILQVFNLNVWSEKFPMFPFFPDLS